MPVTNTSLVPVSQSYVTTGAPAPARTVPAMTAANPSAATATAAATTPATAVTPFGYSQAQADAIRAGVNALITDVASLRTQLTAALVDAADNRKVLTALVTDLKASGLIQ